jgi:hypothetical protein
LTATTRNPLGAAAKATYNVNRALKTLENPMVTNAEMGNTIADIASVYQGGSPSDMAMKHQDWETLYGAAKTMLQRITGKPQNIVPEAIRQRLREDLINMKKTNSAQIKQQLDYTEKAKKRIIDKFPEEWADMRKTIESDAYSGLEENVKTGSNESKTSSGNRFTWQ